MPLAHENCPLVKQLHPDPVSTEGGVKSGHHSEVRGANKVGDKTEGVFQYSTH